MTTPARILRDEADELLQQRRRLPTRYLERENEIVKAATGFFTNHGRCAITFANAASAFRMDPRTLRRYFTDLDRLLFEILQRHLFAILEAFQSIRPDHPNPVAARQEAYRNATQGAFSVPTPAHFLLNQQRFTLPQDLLAQIETMRTAIGRTLHPAKPELALALLDNPDLTPNEAAALLAYATAPPAPETASEPAPEPAAEPIAAAPPRREKPRRDIACRHRIALPPPMAQAPPSRAGP